jgi:hypothetical protein
MFAMLPAVAVMMLEPVSAYVKPECPPVDPLTYSVLLPNYDDCTTYYLCSKGVPILYPCPDGLYFNPKSDVCDWPFNVEVDPYGIYGCQPPKQDDENGGNGNGNGNYGGSIKNHFLDCTDGGVETGVIPAGGTLTILGVTFSGNAGEAFYVVWERWDCEEGGTECDSSQGGVRVTSSGRV